MLSARPGTGERARGGGAGRPWHNRGVERAAAAPTEADVLAALRRVLDELRREVHPELAGRPVGPASALDRDLGLDSLARVELLGRVERALGVRLPERVAIEAETVADLVAAVRAAAPAGAGAAAPVAEVALPTPADGDLPDDARTLIDVLDHHAALHPGRGQVWLYDDEGAVEELSFARLLADAERVAGGLLARGLEPKKAVAVMLPTGSEFFAAFFGVLLAGGVPVPLYPPTRPSQLEGHTRRQAGILRRAEAPFLVTVPAARRLGPFLASLAPDLREVVDVGRLLGAERHRGRPPLRADDPAFYQFTSGSTGAPKGVVLTHANLLENMREIGRWVEPRPDDVFVSWLPLYHDMGLIGAVLTTLYHAVPLVLMSPLAFLVRPERWLQAMDRHRGTLSAAPNFAYALCVKKVPAEALSGLDLSAWRMTLNGAEPIAADAMARFAERLAPTGYRPEAMTPCYGLAENSLALTMTPLERAPRVDRLDRDAFTRRRRAEPAAPDAPDPLEVVSCGAPLPGCEVRIVGEDGRELEERREGRLELRSPSATAGYFNDPEATARLIAPDGWVDSGDLAYVAGGEVYVTGRIKDVVIRAGRNVYPYELEEAVGELPGVRKGCVAVFGARRAGAATEALVVLAETRADDPAGRDRLRERIVGLAADLLGEPPDDVVLAAPHTVLKTSSGKVRRSACRDLYERGELGRAGRAVWVQLARMSARGVLGTARRRLEALAEAAYAARFWGSFGPLLGGAWVAAAALPRRELRWKAARAAARGFLGVTGLTPRARGVERLDRDGPLVAVSNHQSYLDGIVVAAVSPRDPAVVVKSELEASRFFRVLLGRLGAVFVERFDRAGGAVGARRVGEALREGRPVVVFPEGTCLRMPGLLPFHMGAFVAAVEAGAPVVPVTIRGTRSALRPDTWFPRRGRVEVEVGEPLVPEGEGWAAAVALRDRARAAILAACGEPDLAHVDARDHLGDPSTGA